MGPAPEPLLTMNRLLRLVPLGRHLDRRALHVGVEVLFWAALAAAYEILGRRSTSDWLDLLAGAALLALAVTTAGPPLRFAAPRVAIRLARQAGAALEHLFDAHYGADFHPEREPRLPRLGRYRAVIVVLGTIDIALGGALLTLGSPLLALEQTSYLAYLLAALVVWIGITVTLTSLLLTLLQQLRLAPSRRHHPLGRRRVLLVLASLGVAIALMMQLDALIGAQGWLAAMGLSLILLLPPRFGPRVEFQLNLRAPDTRSPQRLEATTVEEMVRSFLAVLVLSALALALAIQGHRLPFAMAAPEMATRMAITHYAGRVVAWVFGFGALAGVGLYLFEFTVRRWRSDPAFPGSVATDRDLVISLVQTNLALARAGRRDRGEGFLYAPHWWPSDRMYRDAWHEDDLSEGSSGPDFHHHYGQPARRLLRQVLRSLSIDLIYIEDGVPSNRMGDVMRLLFRHFDATAGRAAPERVLEERHLASPPGVHLALQEIEIDAPQRKIEEGYKEPSYESLSRARLLLVLRARGGDEPDEDPFAFTREPGWVDRFLSRLPVGPAASSV